MATELDRAWDASSKASDSGAIAFGEHRAYPQAIRDNKAAQAAWKRVESQATKQFDTGLALDARARVGELEVAMTALKQDLAMHMRLKPSAPSWGGLQGLAPLGWGGQASSSSSVSSGGGKKKVALWAAGLLVLAKLAHLF